MLTQTLDDAAVIALIPGLVLVLRRTGMPRRLGAVAALGAGVLLVGLVGLAGGVAVSSATVAGWILTGLIDGLAAAGLMTMTATPDGAARSTSDHAIDGGGAEPRAWPPRRRGERTQRR